MAQAGKSQASIRPYGVAIHQALQGGDLDNMKKVRDEAQQWLSQHGDVGAALEVLKAEIAKAERKP